MRRKRRRTLELVFARPVSGNIPWRRVEALLVALGAEISERGGSRMGARLYGDRRVSTARIPRRTSPSARLSASGMAQAKRSGAVRNTMEIDGYRAVIQFDPEIDMFRGEFVGLNGGADFYARDPDGLGREGAESLRVFLAMCEEDGVEPRRRNAGGLNRPRLP